MTKRNCNIENLKNIEINYDPNELVNKEKLQKFILNGSSYKIKTITTVDGKNVVVNDMILNHLKENKIELKTLTYDKLMSFNFYKQGDYITLMDLLKDAKGSIITYIEIVDNSKKNIKEKELLSTISTYGVNAVIVSNEKKVVKYIKKKAPNVIRGYKFKTFDENNEIGYFERNRIMKVKVPFGTKPDFIEYDINRIPNEYINDKFVVSSLIDTDSKLNKARVKSNAFIVKNNYSDREV